LETCHKFLQVLAMPQIERRSGRSVAQTAANVAVRASLLARKAKRKAERFRVRSTPGLRSNAAALRLPASRPSGTPFRLDASNASGARFTPTRSGCCAGSTSHE
jgi:hypothetical protein